MNFEETFEAVNAAVAHFLDVVYSNSISYVLMFVLLGTGIYFTVRMRGMQFRMFAHMWGVILKSREGAKGGISSFQAFTIGLADRVGTGAIAGVALAVVAGGPGAVFWMWVVAMVGMATAFVEATLAQMFKVRVGDGTFRGGPAFYIQTGLKSRKWGIVFAVLLIFTYGFSFQMIQSNSISQLAKVAFGVPLWVTALILVVMTLPLLVGGVRRIARFTEWLAPAMALVYLLASLVIIGINIDKIPFVFKEIFLGAFGQGTYVPPAVAGGLGAFIVALQIGVKRGLFTNEAGMGSAPNAAATATVDHPVTQGMVQALGVFVDTMLVCTSTAFIILMSQPFWQHSSGAALDGTALTAASMVSSLGFSKTVEIAVSIFVMLMMVCFGYSTILGNYAYAESNYKYIAGVKNRATPLKIIVIFATFLGAVLPLQSVWNLSDWAAAFMSIVNLVAIVLLGKWAMGALKDYNRQRAQGIETPVFCCKDNPDMPGELPTDVWTTPGGHDDVLDRVQG